MELTIFLHLLYKLAMLAIEGKEETDAGKQFFDRVVSTEWTTCTLHIAKRDRRRFKEADDAIHRLKWN